jgi:hypothetical protein
MKSKFLLAIVLMLALISCTKKNITPEFKSLDVPKELIGTWQWAFDYGGLFPTYYTPQSIRMTIKIQFDADHIYKYFENDDLLMQSKFILKRDVSFTVNDSALIISNIPSSPKRIVFKDLDSLILYDERRNGFEHHYSRLK